MPRVTTGNTMAPCVIIGERAAEIIRNQHQIEALSVPTHGEETQLVATKGGKKEW